MIYAITRIGKSTPFAICSCGRPWRLSTRSEKTSKQPVRAAAAALPGVEGVTVHLTTMTDEERKTVHMAQLVGVPIAGVVENMAYFKCPDTGRQHLIFGPSHAGEVTEAAHAPLLARLPINPLVTGLCAIGVSACWLRWSRGSASARNAPAAWSILMSSGQPGLHAALTRQK